MTWDSVSDVLAKVTSGLTSVSPLLCFFMSIYSVFKLECMKIKLEVNHLALRVG
jgi:hypothetical protein